MNNLMQRLIAVWAEVEQSIIEEYGICQKQLIAKLHLVLIR